MRRTGDQAEARRSVRRASASRSAGTRGSKRGLKRQRSRFTALFTACLLLLQSVYAGVGFAQTVTTITTDGNTLTYVDDTTGPVINVTTGTTIDNIGLNSFTRFDVGNDSTVNLHLPGGASRLVNLVYDTRQSFIDGTLNAIQGDQIGGHVYFLNPYGIVVGQSGVVNVGALTLMAPDQEFMSGFFPEQGRFF